jgi:hypothetical protein
VRDGAQVGVDRGEQRFLRAWIAAAQLVKQSSDVLACHGPLAL